MNQKTRITYWLLATLLPCLGAAIVFLWLQTTSSDGGCISGPGTPDLADLVVLILAVPAPIAWYVHRATGSIRKALAPMFMSVLLGAPLVMFTMFAFWGLHQCWE